ncbi:sugar phosphate isomerase/epimerase family protein [Mucilaginibacter sp. 22184]
MEIKILSPQWGHEHLPLTDFLDKVRLSGYDGVDTWIPLNKDDKRLLFDYLQQHQMYLVSHQHRAEGCTFKKFRASFIENLEECAEPKPLLINSHTGRDYFSFDQNLALIDTALEFSAKTGIRVVHETHRGRLGYSPQMLTDFFATRPDFRITADFSHWVCVTESMLENFTLIMDEAVKRSIHIHARVGFEQGPQVADPRAPEWAYALHQFLGWWDKIISVNNQLGIPLFTITTEFGPEPYMPKVPFSNKPMANQFEINTFMKDLLCKRYNTPSSAFNKP